MILIYDILTALTRKGPYSYLFFTTLNSCVTSGIDIASIYTRHKSTIFYVLYFKPPSDFEAKNYCIFFSTTELTEELNSFTYRTSI